MKKVQQLGVPIGMSLLLVVFVLLAMITFATLSLVTAQTNYRFSQSTADATKQYYSADATARLTIQVIDNKLSQIEASDPADFFIQAQDALSDQYSITLNDDGMNVVFTTQVNEAEVIESNIHIMYETEPITEIVSWKLLNTD